MTVYFGGQGVTRCRVGALPPQETMVGTFSSSVEILFELTVGYDGRSWHNIKNGPQGITKCYIVMLYRNPVMSFSELDPEPRRTPSWQKARCSRERLHGQHGLFFKIVGMAVDKIHRIQQDINIELA